MVGDSERRTLSTQPVHSCSWSQMTLGRCCSERDCMIVGPMAVPTPRITPISPQ